MTLGQNIARLRAQKNFSQGDLADALEVSRQSVSKWETDASIPELDKLLRLAELFGVSLDELVKGEVPSETERIPYAEDTETDVSSARPAAATDTQRSTRKIVGTILLCFGALIGILIAIFEGTLAGFLLALPLFVCGTICLTVRRRTGLWCAWALYGCFALYLRFATGLVWGGIFHTLSWTARDNYMRLAICWVIAIFLFAMVAWTLYSYRMLTIRWKRKNIVLLALGWLVHIGGRWAMLQWLLYMIQQRNLTGYSKLLALNNIVDSLQDLVMVALAVCTVGLWRGWRKRKAEEKEADA